jgi:hypothetical protein
LQDGKHFRARPQALQLTSFRGRACRRLRCVCLVFSDLQPLFRSKARAGKHCARLPWNMRSPFTANSLWAFLKLCLPPLGDNDKASDQHLVITGKRPSFYEGEGVRTCSHFQWIWCPGVHGNIKCQVRPKTNPSTHFCSTQLALPFGRRGPTDTKVAQSISRKVHSGSIK